MANNYLVTLASEQLYRAAKEFITRLESNGYEEKRGYEILPPLIKPLVEAVAQYRNLAYQNDWVVEMKALPVTDETP